MTDKTQPELKVGHRRRAGDAAGLLREYGTSHLIERGGWRHHHGWLRHRLHAVPAGAHLRGLRSKHAEAGVPINVLRELMDHRKLDTPRGNYSVGGKRRWLQ